MRAFSLLIALLVSAPVFAGPYECAQAIFRFDAISGNAKAIKRFSEDQMPDVVRLCEGHLQEYGTLEARASFSLATQSCPFAGYDGKISLGAILEREKCHMNVIRRMIVDGTFPSYNR